MKRSNTERSTTKSQSSVSNEEKKSKQEGSEKQPRTVTLMDLDATDAEIDQALKGLYGDD